jgi:hypothetical protein
MSKHRNNLPQLSGGFFIMNGGLETTLIYHEDIRLPCFASFDILKDEKGCQLMKNYLGKFGQIVQKIDFITDKIDEKPGIDIKKDG